MAEGAVIARGAPEVVCVDPGVIDAYLGAEPGAQSAAA